MKNYIFTVVLVFSFFIPMHYAEAFLDVEVGHPNYEASQYLREHGVINGYSDDTFRPDQLVNRAEFLKMLYTADDGFSFQENDEVPGFIDVSRDVWFYEYVRKAQLDDLVVGYGENVFKPEREINFAEVAKILSIYYLDTNESGEDLEWFSPYFDELSDVKIIPVSIDSAGQLMTRGEVAEMIYRIKADKRDKFVKVWDGDEFYVPQRELGHEFSEDLNSVYYKGEKQDFLDRESFEILGAKSMGIGFFVKDKDAVYSVSRDVLSQVEGADLETFKPVANFLGKDKNFIYSNTDVIDIPDADAASFEYIDGSVYYYRDVHNVYYYDFVWDIPWTKVEGADPDTFVAVARRYAKDVNNAYFLDHKIEGANALTFNAAGNYGYDDDQIYYLDEAIEGSNGSGFDYLGRTYPEVMFDSYAYDGERFYIDDQSVNEDEILPFALKGMSENDYTEEWRNDEFGVKFTITNLYPLNDGYEIVKEGNTVGVRPVEFNEGVEPYFFDYIEMHLKAEDVSTEDAINALIISEGNDPADCEIVESPNTMQLLGTNSYSIGLSESAEWTEEELQEISNAKAYPDYTQPFYNESFISRKIYNQKVKDMCYSKFDHAGLGTSSSSPAQFWDNPLKNPETFIFIPESYDPRFFDVVEFY